MATLNNLKALRSCKREESLLTTDDERVRQCEDCGCWAILLGEVIYYSEAESQKSAILDAERQRLGNRGDS